MDRGSPRLVCAFGVTSVSLGTLCAATCPGHKTKSKESKASDPKGIAKTPIQLWRSFSYQFFRNAAQRCLCSHFSFFSCSPHCRSFWELSWDCSCFCVHLGGLFYHLQQVTTPASAAHPSCGRVGTFSETQNETPEHRQRFSFLSNERWQIKGISWTSQNYRINLVRKDLWDHLI